MQAEDVLRAVIYLFVALPATMFVLLYLTHLAFIRKTVEAWHMMIFTGVIAFLCWDLLGYTVLSLWDFSVYRFLASFAVAGIMLWQRVYLLLKYMVLPVNRKRARRRAETKKRALQQVD